MLKKVVVAADSFKGSLSSREVADAVEAAFRKVCGAQGEIVKLSIADGGEGTMQTLVDSLDGKWVTATVHDPLMRPIDVRYGIIQEHTAIIEMAVASGLPLLSTTERNPLHTTTYGTGELIADALQCGCRRFLLGIGGSATNDAGVGMLQALGFRFLDHSGQPVVQGGQGLAHIAVIDDSNVLPALSEAQFTVACDVNNPFSGPQGAAYVYAPQKGATAAIVETLDRGLQHFSQLVRKYKNIDLETIAGAGAAGGLGGGLVAFLGTQLKPGIEVVLDAVDFDRQVASADLVITGEGKLDAQTAMGKAPAGILKRAARQGIPVIAIGGSVEATELLNELGFTAVFPILPHPATLEQAMDKAFTKVNIERTATQIFRLLNN